MCLCGMREQGNEPDEIRVVRMQRETGDTVEHVGLFVLARLPTGNHETLQRSPRRVTYKIRHVRLKRGSEPAGCLFLSIPFLSSGLPGYMVHSYPSQGGHLAELTYVRAINHFLFCRNVAVSYTFSH